MQNSFLNKYLILINRLSVSNGFMLFWLGLFFFVTYVLKDFFSFYVQNFNYYFEWVFAIVSILLFWQELKIKQKVGLFFASQVALSLIAGGCIQVLIFNLNFPTPYDLGSIWALISLIVIGPLIQELIFRFSLWVPLKRLVYGKETYLIVISSLLFSFDHFSHVFIRPQSMHSFIYLQSFYTLALGLWWAWSYIKSKTILMPIFMHIAFNLGFNLASRIVIG